jgi:histidinol-phosphate aminotransferase
MFTNGLTRRALARDLGAFAAAFALGGEALYAQRRGVRGRNPNDLVLLNANENPEGPPQVSIDAMSRILARTGRYHDEDMEQLSADLARGEGLQPEQVLVGCGSSEILHCAVDAFVSPGRPLITSSPSYELPVDMASAQGHPVVKLAMTQDYGADVRKMVEAADRAKGGLIYVVNPNNPTASITPKADIAWLCSNLPVNTVALVDEAYIHFSKSPQLASAIPFVKQNKNVLVTRTFSKIYGMAGLRVGHGFAPAELINKMAVFRNNTISLTGVFAAKAAYAASASLVPERLAKYGRIRADLLQWLDGHRIGFIPPHANFVMIDVKRNVRGVIGEMLDRGVAVGRPFPPLDNMLRVTIGSDADMAAFKREFAKVMKV